MPLGLTWGLPLVLSPPQFWTPTVRTPMARAFIFPGQGSQAVGMGKALAEAFAAAREVFEEVDEALQQKLSRLMWEGPESDLILTENAQPAIMAASYAVIRVLQKEGGPRFRASCAPRGRTLAGRVHGAGGRRRLHAGRCGAAPENPRPRHAGRRSRGRGRHERASGHRHRRGGSRRPGSRRPGRDLRRRQRQCAGPGGDFGQVRRRLPARAKSRRRKAPSAPCRSPSARRSIVR